MIQAKREYLPTFNGLGHLGFSKAGCHREYRLQRLQIYKEISILGCTATGRRHLNGLMDMVPSMEYAGMSKQIDGL